MVIAHGAEVIQAICVGQILDKGVALADFFVVAVQVTHYRLEVYHRFAIQRYHHAEHAMGGRMLRPHVDRDFVGLHARLLVAGVGDAGVHFCLNIVLIPCGQPAGRILHIFTVGIFFFSAEHFAARPAAAKWFMVFLVEHFAPIFAQGVAIEAVPGEDTAQIVVAIKADTEQIPRFTLLEIGTGPDGGQGRHDGIVAVYLYVQHQGAAAFIDAVGVVDHFQFVVVDLVYAGNAAEVVEANFIAQGSGNFY